MDVINQDEVRKERD